MAYFTEQQKANLAAGRSVFDNGAPPATQPPATPAPVVSNPVTPAVPAPAKDVNRISSSVLNTSSPNLAAQANKKGTFVTVDNGKVSGRTALDIGTQSENQYLETAINGADYAKDPSQYYVTYKSSDGKTLYGVKKPQPIQNTSNSSTGGSQTNANGQSDINGQTVQEASKSALDLKMDMANNFQKNKAAETAEAKEENGVTDIQTQMTEAQKLADKSMAKIETMKTGLEVNDIVNEEAKIALKSKIEGQVIPMSFINGQLLKGMNDLDQTQRLKRLYDVYELNSNVNVYNAQLRGVQLLQGQYTQAMDNVKASVDDWVAEQGLKMDILTEQGQLEKEERSKIESEINYERGLMEEGYVYVENTDTYNKLVKQFGVNAGNFSSFFYKDPSNGKIYLKPGATEMTSAGSVISSSSGGSSSAKNSGTSAGVNFTPTEKKKLEQAGLSKSDRQTQLDYLYGKNTTTGATSSNGNIKLTVGQQDDLSQMETVSNIVDQILNYNADGKLEGIGSFGLGTLKSWLAQAGFSSEEGMTVRALIGNIKGTIAKLRGGTSFTPNEEKLLESYTPAINDNPKVAINKLNLLKDFIVLKRENLYKFANGGQNQSNTNTATDLRTKYNY